MRRTRHVTLPVRSWQYIGLLVVSLACLTLGLVSRDREGRAGSLAGPELEHRAPHEMDACPNSSPLTQAPVCSILDDDQTGSSISREVRASRTTVSPSRVRAVRSQSLDRESRVRLQDVRRMRVVSRTDLRNSLRHSRQERSTANDPTTRLSRHLESVDRREPTERRENRENLKRNRIVEQRDRRGDRRARLTERRDSSDIRNRRVERSRSLERRLNDLNRLERNERREAAQREDRRDDVRERRAVSVDRRDPRVVERRSNERREISRGNRGEERRDMLSRNVAERRASSVDRRDRRNYRSPVRSLTRGELNRSNRVDLPEIRRSIRSTAEERRASRYSDLAREQTERQTQRSLSRDSRRRELNRSNRVDLPEIRRSVRSTAEERRASRYSDLAREQTERQTQRSLSRDSRRRELNRSNRVDLPEIRRSVRSTAEERRASRYSDLAREQTERQTQRSLPRDSTRRELNRSNRVDLPEIRRSVRSNANERRASRYSDLAREQTERQTQRSLPRDSTRRELNRSNRVDLPEIRRSVRSNANERRASRYSDLAREQTERQTQRSLPRDSTRRELNRSNRVDLPEIRRSVRSNANERRASRYSDLAREQTERQTQRSLSRDSTRRELNRSNRVDLPEIRRSVRSVTGERRASRSSNLAGEETERQTRRSLSRDSSRREELYRSDSRVRRQNFRSVERRDTRSSESSAERRTLERTRSNEQIREVVRGQYRSRQASNVRSADESVSTDSRRERAVRLQRDADGRSVRVRLTNGRTTRLDSGSRSLERREPTDSERKERAARSELRTNRIGDSSERRERSNRFFVARELQRRTVGASRIGKRELDQRRLNRVLNDRRSSRWEAVGESLERRSNLDSLNRKEERRIRQADRRTERDLMARREARQRLDENRREVLPTNALRSIERENRLTTIRDRNVNDLQRSRNDRQRLGRISEKNTRDYMAELVRQTRASNQNRENNVESSITRSYANTRSLLARERTVRDASRNRELASRRKFVMNPNLLKEDNSMKYNLSIEIMRQAVVIGLCAIYGLSVFYRKGSYISNVVRQTPRFIVW